MLFNQVLMIFGKPNKVEIHWILRHMLFHRSETITNKAHPWASIDDISSEKVPLTSLFLLISLDEQIQPGERLIVSRHIGSYADNQQLELYLEPDWQLVTKLQYVRQSYNVSGKISICSQLLVQLHAVPAESSRCSSEKALSIGQF